MGKPFQGRTLLSLLPAVIVLILGAIILSSCGQGNPTSSSVAAQNVPTQPGTAPAGQLLSVQSTPTGITITVTPLDSKKTYHLYMVDGLNNGSAPVRPQLLQPANSNLYKATLLQDKSYAFLLFELDKNQLEQFTGSYILSAPGKDAKRQDTIANRPLAEAIGATPFGMNALGTTPVGPSCGSGCGEYFTIDYEIWVPQPPDSNNNSYCGPNHIVKYTSITHSYLDAGQGWVSCVVWLPAPPMVACGGRVAGVSYRNVPCTQCEQCNGQPHQNYPVWGQCNNEPWADDIYDHEDPPVTICHSGCALTDYAMALAAAGLTLPDGTPINPGSLNSWLKNNGGFDQKGFIQWRVIKNYFNTALNTFGSSNSADVDAALAKCKPVMIAATTSNGSHYELVTKKNTCGEGYFIIDPKRQLDPPYAPDAYYRPTLPAFTSITTF